ncbi:MAG TPA: hypothetical protein DEB05_14495 [Firmicutes bacterium]|jgi:hypothetical protein|nr:hypothetical protein [Bacillota bacterium]HBT18152.1 hypothetical protein [Bacillota bacterium]
MKGVFWKEGESFTSSMSLIVSLLIRYPEIATLKLAPEDKSFLFSFIFKRKFSVEEERLFREELEMNLGALAMLIQCNPTIVDFTFKRQKDVSFLEIKRDIASLSQEEISLMIKIINNKYEQEIIKDMEENIGEEELVFQEEMIDHMLEDIKDLQQEQELIGIREEGRVMIFNHSDPPLS